MDFCRTQIKSDCEELLSRFQQTESVRFETFCKIWREMKFSHIFYGAVKREQRQFSRMILDTAYSFFLPPFSFQIRVGGLYLLHSLYHCQTASPPQQIRLAMKDWEDVQKFEKDVLNAQHYDAVYILRRLMLVKAFHFTAMPSVLVYKKKRKVERSLLCEDFIERPSRPQELINTELLEELSHIDQLYENLKTAVCSDKADSSVRLIRKDLVPQLRSTVMGFYKWQLKKEAGEEEEDSGEGTSSQQDSSSRAQLLSLIKSKAYGEALEAPKSRRHRQVEVDLSDESRPSNTPGSSRISKPSLKSRTCWSLGISGDVWKEAELTTTINRLTTVDSAPEKPKKNLKSGRHGSGS